MDHNLGLIIPIKEMLAPEVSNILYNPGKATFFPHFLLSWKYWKLKSPTFSIILAPGNIGNMLFIHFYDFSKKDARRNFTQNPPINEPRSLI